MNTTELFRKMNEADAAWDADQMNLDLLRASDEAYAAYWRAHREAFDEWEAIPDCDAKYNAAINANDTEGCEEDPLRWSEIAMRSYIMLLDSGEYDANGNDNT